MTTSTVLSLTACQQQSLPLYRQGALSLLHSTQPVNFAQTCAAIRETYQLMGLAAPLVVWGESPVSMDFAAVPLERWGTFLGNRLEVERDRFTQSIKAQISWPVQMALEESLRNPLLEVPYTAQLLEQLERNHPGQAKLWQAAVKPELWLESLAVEAFALEVLGCDYNHQAWKALSAVAQHCGWLLPYEGICFVSDRPRQLRLNSQGQLHGEGEVGLAFSDGFSLYANAGVRLPEHYGRLHPRQWQARWIAEEPDLLLKQVLMEGVGYGRLVQELEGEVLDDWNHSSLIQLEITGWEEPILLLKRCCSQTRVMDVLRVPPYLRSAQSAACWVHWNLQVVKI